MRKKFLLMIFVLSLFTSMGGGWLHAQTKNGVLSTNAETITLFKDDFNDGNLDGWGLIDGDNDGNNWYFLDNGNGEGNGCIISKSYLNKKVLRPKNYIYAKDSYLISESSVLTWDACPSHSNYVFDSYSVVISTNKTDWVKVFTENFNEYSPTSFITHSLKFADDDEAAEYVGKKVYFGFLCDGFHEDGNCDGVKIDNIKLTGAAPAAEPVAKIGETPYTSFADALNAAKSMTGDVTVEILDNINLTGIDWNPVTVSAPGYPVVTVEGNNKTITGLNDMLFAGTWAGNSGLIIKNLTIAESTIKHDVEDTKGNIGVGAFVGFPQASSVITLDNCHLVNSTVEGGHWTGGLIGYAAGYAGTDGPVFMNLTVNNCSVKESTITGKGSVGGIIGHGSGNAWTMVEIQGTTVSGNTITSTGSSDNKAGAVMGTIGAAGQATTVNGVEKQGGALVAATVSGNTVKSNGTAITTIYGRQGTNTGVLELNGGSYDNYPIEEGVAYAAPAEGYKIVKNANNTYGIEEDPAYGKVAKIGDNYYETLAAAVDAAQENDEVVIFKAGTYALKVKNNVTITGAVNGVEFANIGAFGCNGANVTFNNVTFTYANNSTYKGLQHSGSLVYNNCTFNGQVFLYGASETFNNCTFNTTDSNNYNVWTYGAKEVAFNGCTFNSAGKSVLIYHESASVTNNVSVAKCQFEASQVVEGKAAIEMDSSLSKGINLTIDGKTTATGFGTGNVSGNSLWNNKKGNADVANNDITVTVDNTVVLKPIILALEGEGTAENPYLINNLEELVWFRDNVDKTSQDGSTQYAGKYIKLTADIDLAGINWNPIGSMSSDHGSFKGVFDGGNHTISNLNCEQAGNGLGLFARTAGNAEIKNLKLNNVTVKSTDNSNYVGGVVGNAYASTKINNVHVSGTINIAGCGYIGGIAGHGYVVMDDVSVVANEGSLITSTFWCAGGILGYAGEGSTNIMNAKVEGITITSAAGGLGAIVGMAEDNEGTQPISGSNLSAKNVKIKTYVGAYGTYYEDYAIGYLYGGNPTSKLTGKLNVENVTLTNASGKTPAEVSDAVANVDGKIYFAFSNNEFKLLENGNNVTILRAGKYSIPTGKDLTITGAVNGVVFENIGAYGMGGANVTFNNVTFNYADNSTYKGLQHSGNLVYNNCTINGQVFLYGESETFNGCTFNTKDSNNYNVWTYGAKNVAFNECTFNSAGKSVLIYAESAEIFNNVTVAKCTFNASQAVEGKAAIEMDSSLTGGINLTIDAETTATGFGTGNVSGNSLWNNKKDNNDITVVVNNETVLAPIDGDGTEAKPYLINNVRELVAFRESVNAGKTEFNAPGVYVALNADIDLAGTTWERGIGDGINATFDGIFDGKGKTIKNLTMNPTPDSDGYVCGGLFGYIYGAATIKNLVIENATITATVNGEGQGHNVGVLVGFAYNKGGKANISNITVKGDVKVDAPNVYGVGSIVGYSYYDMGTIDNCKVLANEGSYIKGKRYVGGITGYSYDNAVITKCIVNNLALTGEIGVGGIAGLAKNGNNIAECTVTNVTVNGDKNVAYIVGELQGEGGSVIIADNNNAPQPWVGGSWGSGEPFVAMVGTKYYTSISKAIEVAQAGETVTILAGTYPVPAMKAGIKIEGQGDVLFEGTLSGTLENLTMKNIHIKGGNAQRWAYAKGDLVFENVTFEATSVYALHFDGIAAGTNLTYKDCTIIGWAAMGGSPASCTFDGCTIKGNGTYGVIRTYFDATIKDCTFDVANVNTNDIYEDGIHAVSGAEVTVTECTNANGDMKDLVNVHANSVVTVDGVVIKNVVKANDNYYRTLAEAFAANSTGTVTLLDDVDLAGAEWTPVNFNGVFDGQNHTISNLVVNGTGKSNQGFFAQTNNGEIKNVTFENAKVTGRLNVGVVAGTPYTSKYTNVKVTGHVEVNGMAYVGGVGGKNAYANWTDITVDVDATSYVKANSVENGTAYRTYVGGVVGFNGEGGHTFKNISSNIKVIGSTMDIGGIFGIAHYSNKFENITFTGSVEAPADATEVGGIAGVWHNAKGYTVTFTNCTSEGTVTIGEETTTGSIVGAAYNAENETAENSGSLIIDGVESWLKVAQIGEVKYTTLQAAIEDAQNGETVILFANTDEVVSVNVLNKKISIVGEEALFPVLKGGLDFGIDNHSQDAGNITIKGIKFVGNGIKIDDMASVTIEGNIFEDITASNAIYVAADEYTTTLAITNNIITNVAGAGINLRNPINATVTGNAITNVTGNAMTFQNNGAIEDVAGKIVITGNVLTDWANGKKEGRAIRLALGNIADNVIIEENAMIAANAPEEFIKISGTSNAEISVDENYWNGVAPTAAHFLAEGVKIHNYYASYNVETNTLSNLVTLAGEILEKFYTAAGVETTKDQAVYSLSFAVTDYDKKEASVKIGKKPTKQATLNLPTTVEFNGIEYTITLIPANAFHTCYHFVGDLVIPATVKIIENGAFQQCFADSGEKLGTLTLNENLTYIGNAAFLSSRFKGDLVVPSSVEYVGNYAFNNSGMDGTLTINCNVTNRDGFNGSKFTKLVVSEGVTSVGFYRAFAGMKSLKEVTLPSTLKEIGNEAFYEATAINKVYSSAFEAPAINNNNAFDNVVKDNATLCVEYYKNYQNGEWAEFANVYSEFVIQKEGYSLLVKVNDDNCSVQIKDTPKDSEKRKLEIPAEFDYFGTTKEITSIAANGFKSCNFYGEVVVPGTIKTVGNNAFNSCYKINRIVFENGVESIGSSTLGNMYALTYVEFPASLKTIGNNCFTGYGENHKIITIVSYATEVPVAETASSFQQYVADKATLYVFEDVVSKYKNATGWSRFKTIKPIEAKIGETVYYSLAKAIEASKAGDVITLLADVEAADANPVVIPTGVTLDINTHNITANIYGTVKTAGGLWTTVAVPGFNSRDMLGKGAIYNTIDATVVNLANEVNVLAGTIVLNPDPEEEWWTLPGQSLSIATDATFEIPADFKFTVRENTSVVVEGTLVTYGTVYLQAGATVKAEAGLNIQTTVTGHVVDYSNGVYSVVEQTIFTQTIQLKAGWNWFSSYVETDLESLQAALGTSGVMIKTGDYFNEYLEGWGWDGNIESVSSSQMYMIQTSVAHELVLSGKLLENVEITLNNGWNWISFPMNTEVSVTEALANLQNANTGDIIKNGDAFAEYLEGWGWDGTLSTLEPGQGYMYYSNNETPVTFTYSPSSSKSAAKANVTTDGNYWTPNAAQFANNMTMTAVLDVENINYEVAAFVNGECRGSARPIYVEALDAYMLFLTIHGEEVEEMTFKYYDIDTDTEYTLSDRINYSNNAILGSLKEPYMFTRGTTGIGEAELSQLNIYPNPTTTAAEINLNATFDKVEVFNALGVKVAEYSNVDSIDALETAGIYVIRATNNSVISHCRLVVK